MFVFHFFDDPAVRGRSVDLGIAEDVSSQWDLTIANAFTLEERRQLNHAEFRLPFEWFADWIDRLESRLTDDVG